MYIGISGSFEGQNTLVAVVSMAVGAVIGLSIGIDKRVNSGVSKLEKRFIKKPSQEGGTSFTEGFVTASMIFCVGAMTILGSLQAGLTGDNDHALHESDDGWHRGGFLCSVFRFRCSGSQLFSY